MRATKKITAACAAVVLATAMAVGGMSAASASATEVCVPADARTEVVSEAVPAQAAVPAVTHVEYEFAFKQDHPNSPRWESDPNWNANSNGNSTGWIATGNTRVIVDAAEVPAVPAVDAVTIDHPAVVCEDEKPEVVENALYLSHTVGCVDSVPTVTITLRSVNPWIYPTSVEIDGVHSYGPTVDNRTNGTLSGPQKDQSKTRTITFAEDSGEHTVRYRVQAGSEDSLYKGLPVGEWTALTVQSDCAPNVPAYPGDEVVTTDWVTTTDCESGIITSTRQHITTKFVLVDNVWVKGESTSEPESASMPASEEECPIPAEEEPEPELEEKPVVKPVVTTSVDKLPHTGGGDQSPGALIAGLLMALGLATTVGVKLARRN